MTLAVTTRGYDNQRGHWNYAETVQTPAKIRAHGIKVVRTFQLWDDARGSEGQPLLAPAIATRDGLQHDLLILGSMGGTIYALDFATLQPVWTQRVLNAVPGTREMDMYLVDDNWSLLPTPVLDLARGLSWHVGMTSPDGSYAKASWHALAVNLADGTAACAPIDLAAATYQPPDGLPAQRFGSVQRKVRPALTLDYDRAGVSTLYVAAGSFDEDADTNRGWLIAIDVTTVASAHIAAAITTTSRYSGAGIWMSGGGCALDEAGHVFAVAGNGAFDGKTEFGECCIKYAYTPAGNGKVAALSVVGWTTRFTDTGNVAGAAYQTLADTSLIPDNVFDADDQTNGTSNMDSPDDMDECSGVTIMLASVTGFSTDLSFYSGKGGIGVLSDAANPPCPTLTDFAPGTIQAKVYDKLAAITGFTDGFGYPAGMDIMPTDLSELQTTFAGKTHHLHSTPVHYQSPTQGCLLYGGGENGAVRCFQITEPTSGRFLMTYLGSGTALASPGVPSPGGMPGWQITGWSNGKAPGTGVIACWSPYGNANKEICNGRLVLYAADVPAGGVLEVLWDSEAEAQVFVYNKFNPGMIASGVITYCGYNAEILQYA